MINRNERIAFLALNVAMLMVVFGYARSAQAVDPNGDGTNPNSTDKTPASLNLKVRSSLPLITYSNEIKNAEPILSVPSELEITNLSDQKFPKKEQTAIDKEVEKAKVTFQEVIEQTGLPNPDSEISYLPHLVFPKEGGKILKIDFLGTVGENFYAHLGDSWKLIEKVPGLKDPEIDLESGYVVLRSEDGVIKKAVVPETGEVKEAYGWGRDEVRFIRSYEDLGWRREDKTDEKGNFTHIEYRADKGDVLKLTINPTTPGLAALDFNVPELDRVELKRVFKDWSEDLKVTQNFPEHAEWGDMEKVIRESLASTLGDFPDELVSVESIQSNKQIWPYSESIESFLPEGVELSDRNEFLGALLRISFMEPVKGTQSHFIIKNNLWGVQISTDSLIYKPNRQQAELTILHIFGKEAIAGYYGRVASDNTHGSLVNEYLSTLDGVRQLIAFSQMEKFRSLGGYSDEVSQILMRRFHDGDFFAQNGQ